MTQRIMQNNKTFVMDAKTYGWLKKKAKVITKEEQLEKEKLEKAREEKLQTKKMTSRAELEHYGMLRANASQPNQLNDETKKKNINDILRKAFELRQEQEDEIKHCTSLILSAKCLAINEAQIAEKEITKKGEQAEARKSEKLFRKEHIEKVNEYNKAKEVAKQRKQLYAMEIVQQIKDNEFNKKYLQGIKLAEEAKLRKAASNAMIGAEVKYYRDQLAKKEQTRKNLLFLNTELKKIKSNEKELEIIENLERLEYDRKKYQREADYEEEMKTKKFLREKEIKKIQDQQKSSQDRQALKDELMAIRAQDAIEREWRRKELEDEMKRKKTNEELKEARRQQIADTREWFSFETQKDKEQFDRIIRFNLEDREKNNEIKKQTSIKINEHLQSLKQQVADKESVLIEEKRKFFREGLAYQENKAAREETLRSTIRNKIEDLKKHNVPRKHVEDIEMKLRCNKW